MSPAATTGHVARAAGGFGQEGNSAVERSISSLGRQLGGGTIRRLVPRVAPWGLRSGSCLAFDPISQEGSERPPFSQGKPLTFLVEFPSLQH